MENTETNNDWIAEELAEQTKHTDYEELPSLKLTPNVVTEIDVDITNRFETWNGENNGKPVTKKIIPITLNGVRMNWWLNVKNPVYREVLDSLANGVTKVKVLQTGTQANTKYVLVK